MGGRIPYLYLTKKTMTILQVNVVFGQGSTGKIVADVDAHLREIGHRSIICYGRKEAPFQSDVHKFCTEAEAAVHKLANRAGMLMYGGNLLSTRRLESVIRHEKPDVVHLHCINGYCVNIYRLLHFLAKADIPTVMTHHGEFFYTGNCGHALDCLKFAQADGCISCPYPRQATGALFFDRAHAAWCKMKRAIQSFKPDKLVFTAVSQWVKERASLSPIVAGYPCEVVENGLDTDVFKPTPLSAEALKKWPQNGRKTVLHVTASFSDAPGTFKGGDTIVELARRMPDVNFVIVASYSYVTGNLPDNMLLRGRAGSQRELAELYTAADLTVIASKRETFSMIVAESLCCGTPVVGFKAGGPESIAMPWCTRFVEYSEIDALAVATNDMLSSAIDRKIVSDQARLRYSKEMMADKYMAIYQSLFDN